MHDIGIEMQDRAKRGYVGDLQLNGNLSKYKIGPELETVWTWILQCRHTPLPEYLSPNNSKFFGVRSLLDLSIEMSQSRCSSWSGLESPRTITTYHSKERDLIHKLCGWD